MLAIINATLMTITQGTIENGTMLVENGKITAVGHSLSIPDDAEVIDATGKVITPGFIDAHCHVGVYPDGVGYDQADGNESTNPVTPHLRALDALNPHDPAWMELVEGGVTTVLTGPGSANIIGGQWVCVKTAPQPCVEQMVLVEPAGMKMALGENPKRVYGSANKLPSTRMGNAAVLRTALADALNYKAKWDSYKKQLAEYEQKAADGDEKAKKPDQPDFDMKLDALLPLFSGEMVARIHAHRADDILTAIRIMEEFGVKFTIEHATEGYMIADILAEKGVAVTCGPHLRARSKFETRNRTLKNPTILAEAGVKVAIQTDDMLGVKHLAWHAAAAVKYGMKEEDALKAITIHPAEIIGVDDRIGSLESGKDADFVIHSGHPFSYTSHTEMVFINGIRIL
ncbi:MAG: amidohydrolase [Anaerolineae bacterium]|jgi:imidazolonepropionase-like amidohydrolase|nr:amidohydrolase [Anaerolineae bacterium]